MSFHGQFVWYELMTADAGAAAAFYDDVVGWNSRDSGMADMAYTIFNAGETGVAGLFTLTPEMQAGGARPLWMGYVAVDDVDAYAAKVTQAGGVVHRTPADIPGVGRFAMVADPQGAGFVLFKGAEGMESPPPAPMDTPGHFSWRELMTTDREAAFSFYSGLFGWAKGEGYDMGPMGVYQLFSAGAEPIGGMMTRPAEIQGPPFWTYYIQVDGIEAAVSRLKAGGGSVLNGPMQVPTGSWIVQARDPQGAMFCLASATA